MLFLDIVAWEQLAERCNQYLKKGACALVEGRLAIGNYETSDGEKRKAVEVVASDVRSLDGKSGSAAAAPEAAAEAEGADFIPLRAAPRSTL